VDVDAMLKTIPARKVNEWEAYFRLKRQYEDEEQGETKRGDEATQLAKSKTMGR